jgi:hypothetical protein
VADHVREFAASERDCVKLSADTVTVEDADLESAKPLSEKDSDTDCDGFVVTVAVIVPE